MEEQEHAWPLSKAIGSCCGGERDADIWARLAVLKAFSENPKRQNLGSCDGIIG
jgi:hypothetical protein